MNGGSESTSQPSFLCPVCLHKLQKATEFDPEIRYKKLYKFYKDHPYSFAPEITWLQKLFKKFNIEITENVPADKSLICLQESEFDESTLNTPLQEK